MAIDLTLRIGGEGGEGVISAGDFLMQAAVLAGMEVVTFKSFPAEIKGGYALSQLRISDSPILSHGDGFNILLAFNKEAFLINQHLINESSVVLYDSSPENVFEMPDIPGVIIYSVPMGEIAKKQLKAYISKNMVALGVASKLFNISLDILKKSAIKKFSKKGEKIVQLNLNALEAGANYVKENLVKKDSFIFPKSKNTKDVLILEGNQAIALGASIAGCRYYGGYPITPATTIANSLSELILNLKGFVYQAEDEISALGGCLGASFGGTKSFTATAGPGLSLMVELIGLAIMAEIPIVIADVQRGGPSTGMPTKHDQSDLFLACFGSHGDAPRIVLAPSNVEENFYLIIEAFNLAEHYQTPVIFLSDASLSLRVEAINRPDISKIKIINRQQTKSFEQKSEFMRYKNTESGISPVGIPGFINQSYTATGLEHAENSGPRTNIETRIKMTEKRWRKFKNIEEEYPLVEIIGDEDADLGILTWGLTQSISKEAGKRFRASGKKLLEMYPKILWPLPVNKLKKFFESVDKVLIPEANYQGQFCEIIKSKIGYHDKIVKYNIYGGEPFFPKEIENKLNEITFNQIKKSKLNSKQFSSNFV